MIKPRKKNYNHDRGSRFKDPGSRIQDQGSRIQTVGIIGEGKMGTSIFYSLFTRPYSLRWIISEEADLKQLTNGFEKKIQRALKNGIISQNEFNEILYKTVISSDIKDTSDCDLVIEAIPEELTLKRKVFKLLDNTVKPSCILATNSSSINPSRLLPGTNRESFIIGIHYFYPVQLKETVELISTRKTNPEVLTNVEHFLINNNKRILYLNESNSFILNKLLLNIQNESYKIVEQQKATEEQIDNLVKEHLFPVGIFDFMDSVGIDTMLVSIKNYISNYPNQDNYSALTGKLRSMADKGKLGVKSGEGFYDYHSGRKVFVHSDPGVAGSMNQESAREIAEFLKFTYLTTAKRFTMQSGCTIEEMNLAIREYLGLTKGPFE